MNKYKCSICGYIFDEEKENQKLEKISNCPSCTAPTTLYKKVEIEEKEQIEFKSSHEHIDKRVPINKDSLSINRDNEKCILCGNCKSVCQFKQGVYGNYNLEKTNDRAICIDCGQCSLVCPTKAIDIKKDYQKVRDILKDKDKIVIFQTSPSIRVSLGEEFDMKPGTMVEQKIVSALKKLGANYVFDTTFGADLTIMEEANELVDRIKNKKTIPMFTSCCPAWVRFVELFYPKYLENLSTCKSPISMQGAIIKTYFASKMNLDPSKIVNVAITPCTAKKAEIKRKEMNSSATFNNNSDLRDMDYIVTVRELAEWLKEEQINFEELPNTVYDSPLARGTGSGIIFGNSGGVMEAAVRTAYNILTGKDIETLEFNEVRGLESIKEASININGTNLKLAVVSGTENARKLIEKMEQEQKSYDFIEVMACPGGCIAGGGQPKVDMMLQQEVKKERTNTLYEEDHHSKLRYSHENPEILKLYEEFLIKPLGIKSKALLHTTYESRILELDNQKKEQMNI